MNDEILTCPSCGSVDVKSWIGEDSLLYGIDGPDQVTLTVKDVLFHECTTCGQLYSGEEAMQKRQAAVDEYLASKAK